MLNIYKLSHDQENYNYNVYVSAVVIAKSEDDARKCHPYYGWENYDTEDWAHYDDVKVELLGTALKNQKRGVIVAGLREQ
jgi:hypothetical protein